MAQVESSRDSEKAEGASSLLDKMKQQWSNFSHRMDEVNAEAYKEASEQTPPLFELADTIPSVTETLREMFGTPSKSNDHAHNLIPLAMLQDCKGLIFLRMNKVSIGVGSTFGVGCLLIRQENVVLHLRRRSKSHPDHPTKMRTVSGAGWSAPVAVCLDAVDLGLQLGVATSKHVIAIRSLKVLEDIMTLGAVGIGSHGFTIADAQKCFTGDNPKLLTQEGLKADLIDFAVTKGPFLGDTLKNQTLRLDYGSNAAYYKRSLAVYEMLMADPTTVLPEERQAAWEEMVAVLHQAMDKNSYKITS
jgi:lipid-binding SYLF domain-containing protein